MKVLKVDGECGLEKQFWYSDSSVVYISDFSNNLNTENIRASGFTQEKLKFMLMQSEMKADTLVLVGRNQQGFFWKEISIGRTQFGYLNVPSNKIKDFDKVLGSIKGR